MGHVHHASKTLARIDELVQQDQGAAYRGWLGQVIPHIGDAYRTDEDGFRGHMGASLIGRDCAREIWYGFHWTTKSNFPGRIIRLFNRGHLEEARFIALLLMIGCDVYQQDENGNQFRISHAEGHFGGSGDGVVIGCPDLYPGVPALCEFKTSAEKPFEKIKSSGVREAKFEHYVQMNIYMLKMGLGVALYMVVNKNNDELYAEIVPLNVEIAKQFLDRGEQLVWMEKPPNRINESPGFWKCRFCDHKPVCHLGKDPNKNCRTCQHSKTIAEAGWMCTLHAKNLSKEEQLIACDNYELREAF